MPEKMASTSRPGRCSVLLSVGFDDHGRDALGHCVDLVADAESAKDLQGAEAQVAGLRIDEDLPPLLHQKRRDPVFGEQRGRGEASDARADNEHREATDIHAIAPLDTDQTELI